MPRPERPGDSARPVWAITGAVDVHGRQALHVALGDAELDALVADLGHSLDRDGHLLAAPQVALLEQYVRHVVVQTPSLQRASVPIVNGVVSATAASLGVIARSRLCPASPSLNGWPPARKSRRGSAGSHAPPAPPPRHTHHYPRRLSHHTT